MKREISIIQFTNTPPTLIFDPNTHAIDSTSYKEFDHITNNPLDNLNNTSNADPDNITIHVAGVNDPVQNNSAININPEEEDSNNDIDDTNSHQYLPHAI